MVISNVIEMMINNRDYACWFDKIEILTRLEISHLESLLPMVELKTESKLFKLIEPMEAIKWGYPSKIIATLPTPKFIDRLCIEELNYCVIHYIEVALDIYYDSEHQAEYESRFLLKHLRKKYCRVPLIYDFQDSTQKTSTKAKKEKLFSNVTGYFGGKNNKLAIYARPSKFNEKPCIHVEFRIRGEQINKKTGIKYITDLLSFEPEQYFMSEVQSVVFECIDNYKLGKWILDALGIFNNGKRKDMRISLAAASFLSIYEIKTITDLINYFKNTKKVIKSHRGARDRWQKKVLALKNCNHFLSPYNNVAKNML